MIVSPNLFAEDVKVIIGATLIDGAGRAPVKDSVDVIEGARIKQDRFTLSSKAELFLIR
jgi:hypothetical protein